MRNSEHANGEACNGFIQPLPRGGSLLRHPFRFIRSRSRMLYGRPLSTRWGFDRGLPAHRYYINLFFQHFADDFKGRCLEFQDRTYLSQFADPLTTQQDVIHIDDSNPVATIVADISKPNGIPSDTFDCIVCTHVLHTIYDFNGAILGMHRILKPGGVLLVAVPQISMCDESQHELWRFTRLGLEQALSASFERENVATQTFGNSIVAAGELRGMIADEFTRSELHSHDTCFAVEVCGRALKKPHPASPVRQVVGKIFGALMLMQEWVVSLCPCV